MDCTIKHESLGRLRIHLHQCYMTLPEADQVEYWIKELAGVNRVKVYDRTADATILYDGKQIHVKELLIVYLLLTIKLVSSKYPNIQDERFNDIMKIKCLITSPQGSLLDGFYQFQFEVPSV